VHGRSSWDSRIEEAEGRGSTLILATTAATTTRSAVELQAYASEAAYLAAERSRLERRGLLADEWMCGERARWMSVF
jgi:hypothetical protein